MGNPKKLRKDGTGSGPVPSYLFRGNFGDETRGEAG